LLLGRLDQATFPKASEEMVLEEPWVCYLFALLYFQACWVIRHRAVVMTVAEWTESYVVFQSPRLEFSGSSQGAFATEIEIVQGFQASLEVETAMKTTVAVM
jgi:hypothetical protein